MILDISNPQFNYEEFFTEFLRWYNANYVYSGISRFYLEEYLRILDPDLEQCKIDNLWGLIVDAENIFGT